MKKKDHKYSEKRFFILSKEEVKKEDEKIYITGINISKNKNRDKKILTSIYYFKNAQFL